VESQQERVLVQLRDLIIKGEFAPGARMTEIGLAERLEASRTPVRLALTRLEQEGLVELSTSGGYVIRRFTALEIAEAIAVRGVLEGMAARLLAEHGLPRQLSLSLRECLQEGDRVLARGELDYDMEAGYGRVNTHFHQLVVQGSGNGALIRAIELNNRLPFAAPSAMLPMQPALNEGRQLLWFTHRQHHNLVEAMESGAGTRAQAIAEEHVQVAQANLRSAMENPEGRPDWASALRLISGA
jgi:GntR family transcriptional regulator of vanillate catabolism